MSLNGDSCSTSSGCVSDLDNLSEDPSPDSPISDTILDSLALKSPPINEEFAEDLIIAKTIILSVNPKVPEEEEEVDEAIGELLDEELIENEIIIDSSPVDCIDSLSLNQILTANCYALEYQTRDEEQEDECLVRDELPTDCYQTTFDTSFGFSRSLNCSSKAETASIKSDTSSHTSGHESDGTTRQSSDSLNSNKKQSSVNLRPTLNGVFKELKDFKCLSQNSTHKSDDIQSNSSKTSTDDSKSGNSSPYYCCKWTHCDWPGSKDDLVDHIREIHVELQPYQQQKHNWNEVQTKTDIKCQTTRKVTDSTSGNTSNTKKVESTQQYVCLWEGCKVYGKGSSSRNWLERHVLEQHSGPRPFKCIVEGCGQRFKVQSALERHVNSHFKPSLDCTNSNCSTDVCPYSGSNSCCANSSNNNSSDSNLCHNSVHGLSPFELHLKQTSRATMSAFRSKTTSSTASVDNNNSSSNCCPNHHLCTNGTPNKILKRKKSNQKVRRKCFYVKCSEDFFDECVMEQVRYGLIQLNAHTGLDISGNQSTVTFHSKVIARRENDSGEVNVLLKWEPNDILPDVWVPEDKVSELKSKTVPVSTLSQDCLAQLIEQNNGFERKPKIKQRRK